MIKLLANLPTKPKVVSLGVIDDHFTLFASLRRQFDTCYLLESQLLNEHGDQMFTMGFDPAAVFSARGQTLTITATETTTITYCNPYEELQKQVPLQLQGDMHQGGLVGNFAYEAVNYFEPSLNLPEHSDFPTFELGLYLDGLVFNNKTKELSYYFYAEDRSDIVKSALENPVTIPKTVNTKRIGHNQTREQHAIAIDYTLEQIRSGNTFQAEVGFKTKFEITGDKLAIYAKLREVNPSPYMYFLQFGDRQLFGSSPEIVVRNTNGKLLTTPAAGTISADQDPTILQNDPKEIAEHNMLIDLHRNDLGKVAKAGSVKLAREKYVNTYSHVQHMLSDITGELADHKTSYDVLAALTPCGVLTGAPKIETIKIIQRNEPEPRGPYGGAVGRFSLNGDCVFTMPIRSLFCNGNDCFAQTASGVVLDSTAEGEYNEVMMKLAAMEQVISECMHTLVGSYES